MTAQRIVTQDAIYYLENGKVVRTETGTEIAARESALKKRGWKVHKPKKK